MNSPDPAPTPFQLIGGQSGVDRIIDSFYDRMDTLPEARIIRGLHPHDLGPVRLVLKKYTDWKRNRPDQTNPS